MIVRLASHKLALVVLLCIVVRVAALAALPGIFDFVSTGVVHGSSSYDNYAQNLLATGVYGLTPGTPDAMIPPLYSVMLWIVYSIFGRGYWQVGLFNTLLDAASIVMLYHIAKQLLPRGEWVGALAGMMYAFYPYLIFQNLTVIDTPLFIFWLHAFVLLMIMLRERPLLDKHTWLISVLGGCTRFLIACTTRVVIFCNICRTLVPVSAELQTNCAAPATGCARWCTYPAPLGHPQLSRVQRFCPTDDNIRLELLAGQ